MDIGAIRYWLANGFQLEILTLLGEKEICFLKDIYGGEVNGLFAPDTGTIFNEADLCIVEDHTTFIPLILDRLLFTHRK